MRNAMKLKPLHDWAVVVPSEAESRTAGGLYIPDSAKEKPEEGVVEAIGPGAYEEKKRGKKEEKKERKFIPTTVKPGDTVLWHAAAGGVGLIACQWLKALGVHTIATAGSDEKAALAKAHGAEHVINYSKENFVEKVKAITGGKGVPVVYDGVGKATWEGSLDCLRPRGLMVTFGNASGAVPPVNLGILSAKGSLYVTRPTLATYIATRAELVERSSALFDVVKSGKVKIETTARYKLADAAQAHRDLESRKTTGSVILTP